MNTAFLNEVKTKRKEKGLSQESVAKYIGITRRAYISFEKGESNFKTEERLRKMCELLEIDPLKEKESEFNNSIKTMAYEVNPKSQIYESLIKLGLALPGNRVTIVVEERN